MRCRNCKEKFVQYEFNNKFCKKLDCQVKKAIFNLTKKKQAEEKNRKQENNIKKSETHKDNFTGELQKAVNKLARSIDGRFFNTCIDCGKTFNKSIHGAHLNNVGGHENIRFNLHNIHSARGHCNQYSSEHKTGYEQGLKTRYSEEYFNYVKYEIDLKYKSINLTGLEIREKLKIVRKLNRDFETFVLTDPKKARDMFNKLIGIYN